MSTPRCARANSVPALPAGPRPAGALALVLVVTVLLGQEGFTAATPDVHSAAAAVQAQLRADAVPVAAWAVVQDGEVTTGARGEGVTDSTPFVLGSISKSFTALAVLQLVDAGRVRLDAPVTRYLPDFRTADPDAVITVEQLLTQTSGLPTSAGVVIVDHPGWSLEQRVRAAAVVQPVSEPGRTFHYSNLNYAVLGRVVEEVSRNSFADYLHENVFVPLDMTGSSTSVLDARAHGLPPASTVWFGVTVARSTPGYPGGAPDGFLVSTARDMSHYLSFQLGDGTYDGARVVSEQSLRTLHAAATTTPPGTAAVDTDAYAMGWGVGEIAGNVLLAHDGDVIGYHANVALLPDRRSGLVVLVARNGALTAADGAATAGTTVLAGATVGDPSQAFRNTYLALDAVAVLLLAVLDRLLRRGGWRRRLASRVQRQRPVRAAVVPVVGHLAAAVGLYVGVFRGLATVTVGFPVSLRFASGFIGPDVTALVIVTCAFFVVRAVLTAVASLRSGARR